MGRAWGEGGPGRGRKASTKAGGAGRGVLWKRDQERQREEGVTPGVGGNCGDRRRTTGGEGGMMDED